MDQNENFPKRYEGNISIEGEVPVEFPAPGSGLSALSVQSSFEEKRVGLLWPIAGVLVYNSFIFFPIAT
jgi:hypothetical protein